MFSLVITNIWQKVNDVALTPYSILVLILFWGVIFHQKRFISSLPRYLCCLFFDFKHELLLLSFILCNILWFLNIFNESWSHKSRLIFDDKTLTYLWRIKFISIYYFVVFYIGHCVLLLPNTLELCRLPVRRFWVYLM